MEFENTERTVRGRDPEVTYDTPDDYITAQHEYFDLNEGQRGKAVTGGREIKRPAVYQSDRKVVEITKTLAEQAATVRNLKRVCVIFAALLLLYPAAIGVPNYFLVKKNDGGAHTPGSVYVRWGRKDCTHTPSGTSLVYSGYMSGGHWQQMGGGADYLCLPHDIQWGFTGNRTIYDVTQIYGVEYEMDENTIGYGTHQYDAPCSVCRTERSTSLMIPGRTTCFPGWTLEYAGYLAANWMGNSTSSQSNFVCIDSHAEILDRGATNDNQGVLHNVVAKCGSLPCPPYKDGPELPCVVCSK